MAIVRVCMPTVIHRYFTHDNVEFSVSFSSSFECDSRQRVELLHGRGKKIISLLHKIPFHIRFVSQKKQVVDTITFNIYLP